MQPQCSQWSPHSAQHLLQLRSPQRQEQLMGLALVLRQWRCSASSKGSGARA